MDEADMRGAGDGCQRDRHASAAMSARVVRAARAMFHGLRMDRRGAAMIEFALLMLPFFTLVFALLEVGFVTWGGLELDNATVDAARLVRIGEAQAGDFDQTRLRQEVCARAFVLFDCTGRLRLEVRGFTSFGAMVPPQALTAQGTLRETFPFQPGGAGDIVMMSTFYEWPLFNIVSSLGFANMASGNRLLQTTIAFRNEPFQEGYP